MSKNLIQSRPMSTFGRFGAIVSNFLIYSRKNWKRLTLIAVAVVIGLVIYKRSTATPAGVTTAEVSRKTMVNYVSANGKVTAHKAADLKFNTLGRVAWISVKNGDKVRAWQGVAGLDTVTSNAAYQQALNNYRNYQAVADKVLDDVKNHEKDEDFALRATRTTAEVNRDNAYDAMLAARDVLSKATLISPIAGTVADTNDLIAGLNMTGSNTETKFIRVVDLNSLYFAADVDEVDYGKVKIGQEAIMDIDAFPGESCNGKVTYVSRYGEETAGGVVTIPTEITFSGCNIEYAVGLNGQARLVLSKQENALVIPKKYLISKKGTDQVWLMTGNTTKNRKLVPVKVGTTTATEAEILEGLAEGETVIFVP